MKRVISWGLALTVAVTLLTITFMQAPLAHAASATTFPRASSAPVTPYGPCGGCGGGGYYYITNIVNGGQYWVQDAMIQLGPGVGGSHSKTVTITTSWSANVGVSGDTVSAGLGFTVGISWGETDTCYANPQNYTQDLVWYSVYIYWLYDIYWHSYYNGSNTYAGSGYALQYDFPACYTYRV